MQTTAAFQPTRYTVVYSAISLIALLTFYPLPLSAQNTVVEKQPISQDEALWQEIHAANQALLKVDPYSDNENTTLQPRKKLLDRARVYLRAYPGGQRRDEVVRLELKALFEIGTLSGGDHAPLQKKVAEYLEHPPSEAALYEAAYWKICCDCVTRVSDTSKSGSNILDCHDIALHRTYQEYITTYPKSRYVPRMVSELCSAAAARDDYLEYRRLLSLLDPYFSEHLVKKTLAAQLRRHETVGKPFSLVFNSVGGGEINTANWRGRPLLIVVWAGFSASSSDCVKKIELLRSKNPKLLVVGVNLDESVPKMTAATQELGITWIQHNDGMGWANAFARHWGVNQIPWIFAVDQAGDLVGSAGADDWLDLARSVLEN